MPISLLSFPSTLSYSVAKSISNPVQCIISQPNNSHGIDLTSLHKPGHILSKSNSSAYPIQPHRQENGTQLLHLGATGSKPGDEDHQALDAVLKFYSAIKNKNTRELSDVIGEECRFFCNFISSFQPFQGKQQVLELITYLIRTLGNNIEFVITPTLDDGLSVAVKWRLECNKTGVPLGKGFSYHLCHVYHGKVVISNVEMIMEPFLHMEPLRLKLYRFLSSLVWQRLTTSFMSSMKLIAFAMTVRNNMHYYREVLKDKKKRMRVVYILLLCLLLLTALSLVI